MLRDWGFEPVVLGAILTALIAMGVSLVMGCLIAIFRVWRRYVERRNKRLVDEWEPLLFVAMDEPVKVKLPPVGRRDLPLFLELWTHLQEATRGQVSEHLNLFLNENIPATSIIDLARNGGIRSRLMAITALGHMRSREAINLLMSLASEPTPVLSYAALRALLRIDAIELLPRVIPTVLARNDWPISRLLAIFRELGANTVTPTLVASLEGSTKSAALRLLPLLGLCHREIVDPAVRRWLVFQTDPEVISAGLEYLRSPQDIPVLVQAAHHNDWRVRACAATGLGEVGGESEGATLIGLLSDRSWWVRYRAAKALVALYGPTSSMLRNISTTTTDNYARDILQQAMAEST